MSYRGRHTRPRKTSAPKSVTLTTTELAAVFRTWERAVRANPDAYVAPEEYTPRQYGSACAKHFVAVLAEVRK